MHISYIHVLTEL